MVYGLLTMVFFPECKNPKKISRIQMGFTLFRDLSQINFGVYSLLTFKYLMAWECA